MTEKARLPAFKREELEIIPLPPGFAPGGFHCREPELCSYLLDGDAARDDTMGVTRTYIVRLRGDGSLVGYFTLLADAIKLELEERPSGLPYVTLPAMKLGRIGVDERHSGRKAADLIFDYIIGLGRSLSESLGLRYVTLDALPRPKLLAYYESQGFVRNINPPLPEDGIGSSDEISMRFDLRG